MSRPIMRARIARALRGLAAVRGWHSLVNRLVPEHSAPFTVRNGSTMFCGDIRSYIDRQVYLFGGYESAGISCFLSRVPTQRRGTVLDVGANAGTHSLAFARCFETVHAFEPNPMLWPQFEKNMGLNGITNVHLHRVGLADRDSEVTLHLIDKPNYGLGTFSTVDQYDLPLRPVATCPIRHAGNYITSLGVHRVDAVKIDVQGYEPDVLRGLSSILKRDQPVLWCEVGVGTLGKIMTTGDISELVPFRVRCFEMTAGHVSDSMRLRERTGALTGGDYVILPA